MPVEWVGEEPPRSDESNPAERPKRLITTNGLIGVTLALGLVAGILIGRATATHHAKQVTAPKVTVSGRVVVSDYTETAPGGTVAACTTNAPYDDVQTAAPILISDMAQHVLGATRLSPGRVDAAGCVFSFSVSIVESGPEYLISVADRPAVAVPQTQLTSVIIRLPSY